MRKFTLILIILLSNCATVINGKKQWVPIITDVPGATVYVDNKLIDSTPCVIKLPRKIDPPTIELTKNGYKKQEITLKVKWNETTALNNVNVFFWAIDYFSGAYLKYRPIDTIQLHKP